MNFEHLSFYKLWKKAVSLFVYVAAMVWCHNMLLKDSALYVKTKQWLWKQISPSLSLPSCFSIPSCYRKWTPTMSLHSTWVQLVAMKMMCSWMQALTALWHFKQMTPSQDSAIHDIGETYSPTFAI